MKPQPQVLTIWRIVLVAVICVPALLTSLLFPLMSNLWMLFSALWVLVFLAYFLVLLPLKYRKLSFTIKGERVILRFGVFFTRVRSITLDNIQFTTIRTGLLGRVMGLCTLQIVAAGGRLSIPGLRRQDAELMASSLPHEWEK